MSPRIYLSLSVCRSSIGLFLGITFERNTTNTKRATESPPWPSLTDQGLFSGKVGILIRLRHMVIFALVRFRTTARTVHIKDHRRSQRSMRWARSQPSAPVVVINARSSAAKEQKVASFAAYPTIGTSSVSSNVAPIFDSFHCGKSVLYSPVWRIEDPSSE